METPNFKYKDVYTCRTKEEADIFADKIKKAGGYNIEVRKTLESMAPLRGYMVLWHNPEGENCASKITIQPQP